MEVKRRRDGGGGGKWNYILGGRSWRGKGGGGRKGGRRMMRKIGRTKGERRMSGDGRKQW